MLLTLPVIFSRGIAANIYLFISQYQIHAYSYKILLKLQERKREPLKVLTTLPP